MLPTKTKKQSISIIGLGFVGLSLAVVNAAKGFNTIAIDTNQSKLQKLVSGHPDFYEPKLEDYLRIALKAKKIQISNDIGQVLKTDITFLTVGTPMGKDGKIDLSQVKKVIKDLANTLNRKKSAHVVVVKSTVIPTTTVELVLPFFRNMKNIHVISNPEFLREGNAINDLLEPHIIVIGKTSKESGSILEKYYKIFYKKMPEIIHTDPTTAEMIKYTNNAFLATKISFINSIANICQNIPNVDVNTIAYAIGKDPRIGPQFLNAGPGFGGSCLPKDLSALISFSSRSSDGNTLLSAVKDLNDKQPGRILELMKQARVLKKNKVVSILGLAFKKNTDDIRDAVSIKVIRSLLKHGLKIRVHDPMAILNFKKLFGSRISYFGKIGECLRGSDCCIILTEWDQYKKIKPNDFKNSMRDPCIIDAKRVLNPKEFSKLHFKAIGLGN